MNPLEIEHFNRCVDQVVHGRRLPADADDPASLSAQDRHTLELARAAARLKFGANPNRKATLRRHLIQRAAQRSQSRPLASRLWITWASLALAVTFVVFSAANQPAVAPISTMPQLAASHNAPAMSIASGDQAPLQKPQLQEIPRPVPTPLAPHTISYSSTAHPLRTPGSASTMGTP